jgi:two-component system, NtrC family, response regulator AtoC
MQAMMEQKIRETSGMRLKNVLIVDDDEVFRLALAEGITLMEGGLSVHTVENGEQAVAIVKNMPVDLVITDLRMPAMDGAELALWLMEERPAVPVIVMSAYAESGTVRELAAQGNHFLDKPLDFNQLMKMIRTLLH